MTRRTYLDHHATTPLDPRVLEAMTPYLTTRFGNASSRHAFGREAKEAVETARAQVARLVGGRPEEIVFTSGATESNNLALKGIIGWRGRGRVLTVATEHSSVLEPAATLEGTVVVPVERDGLVDPERLRSALQDDVLLVSVMAGNNEIGVVQDLAAIGRICADRPVRFHTDAAAASTLALDAESQGFHLASLSAHKIHGPKGAGALYLGARTRLTPMMHGGGHEGGLRAGTLDVAGIVGFGKAAEILLAERESESARLAKLRDRLWESLRKIGGVRLNGHATRRLPGNLNVSFEGVEGDSLAEAIEGIAVSSGAACSAMSAKPSHVLKALGVPEPLIVATLRFGIGRFNTEAEIDAAAAAVSSAVANLRSR